MIKILGVNIKEKRELKGFTQTTLSLKLGVDRSAVAKWETGRSSPPVDKLIIMSDLFGCTIDELVRGDKK